jgi:hypothetical protein
MPLIFALRLASSRLPTACTDGASLSKVARFGGILAGGTLEESDGIEGCASNPAAKPVASRRSNAAP